MSLWTEHQALVCVGPGGVGKTSVAATLALAACAAGRRTLVVTIDPARRLANALGLSDIGNTEHELDSATLAAAGLPNAAPLTVLMPDVKRTFDGMLERFASAETRDKLAQNHIYQRFSSALAGTLEYAAVEKLYELHASGRFDLIVLDTPPAQNAADFLDAPGKVIDFLEQQTPEWLVRPYRMAGKVGARLFDVGGTFISNTLDRFAGAETLRQLTDFVLAFQGMYGGLRERSQKVRALLGADDTAFVLVTTPRPEQRAAALRFREDLAAVGVTVRGIVVNRMRPMICPQAETATLLDQAATRLVSGGANERQLILDAARDEVTLAHEDEQAVDELRALPKAPALFALPELDIDVHELAHLARLSGLLSETI